ncbi:MAG: DNA-processing protein DprA [Steroidobacteraceae bacterium]
MDEQAANLILLRAPALSGAQLFALLHAYGSATASFKAGPAAWREIGLTPLTCYFLQTVHLDTVGTDRAWLEAEHHSLVMIGHPLYPALLQQLTDAPLGLFVSGNPDLLATPQLAIVGSRNPTPYGRELAESFAKHLSTCGLCITSGLAEGIDAASHRGALAGKASGGTTVAVCGTGPDIIYPRSSTDLAREIEQYGALVSEFPPGTQPRKHHFPQRNRIISGLSLGTLVVEAALHSGSLITARQAGEQGREVFAIPGSVHNPLSKGCHHLIQQGAKLVDTAEDILSELGPLAATLRITAQSDTSNPIDSKGFSKSRLDKEYKILLDALGFEPLGVDQLVTRSGLGADAVASMLLILELEECIQSCPGGLYVRARV